MSDMVYWSPRGIGCDSVPCFVTKEAAKAYFKKE